jgi:hypothetical protein
MKITAILRVNGTTYLNLRQAGLAQGRSGINWKQCLLFSVNVNITGLGGQYLPYFLGAGVNNGNRRRQGRRAGRGGPAGTDGGGFREGAGTDGRGSAEGGAREARREAGAGRAQRRDGPGTDGQGGRRPGRARPAPARQDAGRRVPPAPIPPSPPNSRGTPRNRPAGRRGRG